MAAPLPPARIAALLAGALLACTLPGHARRLEAALARASEELVAQLERTRPALTEEQGLEIRLAFGAPADLDLYVTDPRQETVYYANSPSRSGGELVRDLRCDAPAPRIETVRFPDPLPGRYRVGVDFHARCVRTRDPVPFAVEVQRGPERHTTRGRILFGQFQPVVVEFDAEAAPR